VTDKERIAQLERETYVLERWRDECVRGELAAVNRAKAADASADYWQKVAFGMQDMDARAEAAWAAERRQIIEALGVTEDIECGRDLVEAARSVAQACAASTEEAGKWWRALREIRDNPSPFGSELRKLAGQAIGSGERCCETTPCPGHDTQEPAKPPEYTGRYIIAHARPRSG
jgi:hypothetical protein